MDELSVFIHLVFVGFMAMFAPVNPIGTSIIIDPFLHGLDAKARNKAAKKIAIYCFFICLVTILVGSWIFKLFGISLPVVQIAGGTLIAKMGWDLLNKPDSSTSGEGESKIDSAPDSNNRIQDILFFPLSFPMTAGAGAISILLTLSVRGHSPVLSKYLLNLGALFVSILLIAIVIYVCYAKTRLVLGRLGKNGEKIVNRLSAFVIFCVGLQIFADGAKLLLENTGS